MNSTIDCKWGRMGSSLILLLAAGTLVACTEGLSSSESPQLVVSPESVDFPGVSVGSLTSAGVEVSNVGDGGLTIRSLEVLGGQEYTLESEFDLPMTLAKGDSRLISVLYQPESARTSRGVLRIVSNDPDRPTLDVPLQPQEVQARVFIAPNPIDFGRVPAGEERTQPVTLQNIGSFDLMVTDLVVTGSPDFVLNVDPVPTDAEPLVLAPEEFLEFTITYSPSSDAFDQGLLIVRSNDPNNRTINVDILANGAEPCIAVTDEDGVDFSERAVGMSHPREMTITNCSDATNGEPLEVYGIDWLNEGETTSSDAFALDNLPSPLAPEDPLVLDPQTSASFTIVYTPTEVGQIDEAVLRIANNDEFKSQLDIDVRGVGSNNSCPIAVAKCRVQGVAGPWLTEVEAIPLQTLECDGRESNDADGSITNYQWSILEAPDGSVATFQPNSSQPAPTFFVDLAGEYTFELRTWDDTGCESEPATVRIVATPDEDIHVQLVWDTPADTDPGDTGVGRGSDVDLHFLHPSGTWTGPHWDCHFRNRNPNWGDLSRRDDDPSLDRDDTDGAGPENINLDNPEDGVTYRVGVHYWNDHGFGESFATLRLYVGGIKIFEAVDKSLPSTGVFWDVAALTWRASGSPDVTRVDRVYPDGFP